MGFAQVKNNLNNNNKGKSMNFKKIIFLVGSLVALLGFFTLAGFKTIEGDERGVVQTWAGLDGSIMNPGTHFYVPLFKTIHVYDVGSEKFIMGKKEYYNGQGSEYVDYPAVTVTTGGTGNEQPVTFSVTMNYRLSPNTKLIKLHEYAQKKYEDLVIKPNLTRIINDLATTRRVLSFYSGEGRVQLQKDIEVAIMAHPALSAVGIIVDTFVFDSIDLDPAYVSEIQGRQLATQKKLRAIEETKVAVQVAQRVQAEAEAQKLKLIVEAETKKQQAIKLAESEVEKVELAARANATKIKEKASAERFRKEQDAKGLLAQGIAEARVAEAKRDSKYSGVSGLRQAQVEIAKYRVGMFQNMAIKGVLDKDVALTIINNENTPAPMLTVPVK